MSFSKTYISQNRQRGVALVMALVFLMLLTILGVTSMSMSTLEEKMATNTRDRNAAFQAAETALVAGETWINSLSADPTTWPEANKGKYLPSTAAATNWDSVDWNGTDVISYPCNPADGTPTNSSSCTSGGRTSITKVASQPKYIVEKMGQVQATPLRISYRITARGTGNTNASVVMLQSTYVKQY